MVHQVCPGVVGPWVSLRVQELSGISDRQTISHKPLAVHWFQVDVTFGGFDSWKVVSGIFMENAVVALYCEKPGTVLSTPGHQHRD